MENKTHFLILTDRSVAIIVILKSFYRMIHFINHWMKHLETHQYDSLNVNINMNDIQNGQRYIRLFDHQKTISEDISSVGK